MVKVWHPDLNPSPKAKEKFIQIHQAYGVLSDPESKNAYDLELVNPKTKTYSQKPKRKTTTKVRKKKAAPDEDILKNKRTYYQKEAFQAAEMKFKEFQKNSTYQSAFHYYGIRMIGCFIIAVAYISLIVLSAIFLPAIVTIILIFLSPVGIALGSTFWDLKLGNWGKVKKN